MEVPAFDLPRNLDAAGRRDGTPPPCTKDARVQLPQPSGSISRLLAEHPSAADVTIVASYLLVCTIMAILDVAAVPAAAQPDGLGPSTPDYLLWPLLPLTVLRVVAVAAALLLRRRYPLLGLVVISVAMFGDQDSQVVANSIALLFMVYAIPVYRSSAAGWIGYGIAVLASFVQTLVTDAAPLATASNPSDADDGYGVIGDLVFVNASGAIWLLAALMIGINLGNRRRYLSSIIDRAHQLARDRDQRAQLAVATERSRIAREMHDIVAHSVSVMIALSEGAGRAVDPAPDAAAEAMHRSAETGRTALAQMRRTLGVLDDPPGEGVTYMPPPGVDDLSALVRNLEEAGLDIALTIRGKSAGDRGQDLAVYRVVQEGLTNVLRHAGQGARAEVTIERTPESTRATVRDHGPRVSMRGSMASIGAGRGLRGATERVRVFGGHLEAGPVRGGGWRLHATIPASAGASDRSHTGQGEEAAELGTNR